jgi:hypothetical protein
MKFINEEPQISDSTAQILTPEICVPLCEYECLCIHMSGTTVLPFSLAGTVTRRNKVYKYFHAHIEPQAILYKQIIYFFTSSAKCVKIEYEGPFQFTRNS